MTQKVKDKLHLNHNKEADNTEQDASKLPLVSVLLPVYNGAEYLIEAIQSILIQSYKNFELIIINDGSNDESALIIERFKDPRIIFLSQTNQGLAATLNRAIGIANGKYLARQDQDDISLPQRLEKQVSFLEANSDYGMVGTWASIWVGNMETERAHRHPSENLILQFDLLFNNPFVHSSMMVRKTVFHEIGLYSTDKNRQPPEDYELWSRIARKFKVANIPEILHVYREIPKSMSRDDINPFLDRVIKISAENLSWVSGSAVIDQKAIDTAAVMNGGYHHFSTKTKLQDISQMMIQVADTLSTSQGAPRDILRERAQGYFQSLRRRYLSNKYGGRLFTMATALVKKARRLSR